MDWFSLLVFSPGALALVHTLVLTCPEFENEVEGWRGWGKEETDMLKNLWPLGFALCEPRSPHQKLSLEIVHV